MLSKGNSFGELALTAGDDHRSATVRAKTRVEILQLHKVDYDHFVKDFQVAERRENFQVLKNCALFSNWTKAKIQKMCNACSRKSLKAGEYAFRQGDTCDCIYFIIDGKVDVYKEVTVVVRNRWPSASGSKQEGIARKKKKPFLVHSLKNEDYFGEQAVAQNQLRTVSCVATVPTVVLCLDRLEFAHFIENDVAMQLMKNAYDDYVQDKQILNSMIMSCQIKGGPSTTAQLNDCLEIVNEYRPSSAPHIAGAAHTVPNLPIAIDLKSKGQVKASSKANNDKKKQGVKTIIAPLGDEIKHATSSSASREFSRTTTKPLENFFSGNKIPFPRSNSSSSAALLKFKSKSSNSFSGSKHGVLAEEDNEFDEGDQFESLPEDRSTTQPRDLSALKSEHDKILKSKNISKRFSSQLSKMGNCADNLRIHRHKPNPPAVADDVNYEDDVNYDDISVLTNDYEDDVSDDDLSLPSTSTKPQPALSIVTENVVEFQRYGLMFLNDVLRHALYEYWLISPSHTYYCIFRERKVNYLSGSQPQFRPLPTGDDTSVSSNLSFKRTVKSGASKEIAVT